MRSRLTRLIAPVLGGLTALLALLVILPTALHAMSHLLLQLPTPETTTGKLVMLALTPVVGYLATKSYDGFKQLIPKYDSLPDVVHLALAPIWAFALGWVSAKLGLAPTDSLAGIDYAWINGALVALAGAGIFRAEKRKA